MSAELYIVLDALGENLFPGVFRRLGAIVELRSHFLTGRQLGEGEWF